mgnify:CR=1 FL=1
MCGCTGTCTCRNLAIAGYEQNIGTDGETLFYGTTVPPNTLGNESDNFINKTTQSFYKKILGVWVLQFQFVAAVLPDISGLTPGKYARVVVSQKGIVTSASNPIISNPARTVDTPFVVDGVKDAEVRYSINLNGAGASTNVSALLEYSPDGSIWTVIAVARLSVAMLASSSSQLSGYIPATYLVRIRTLIISGTITIGASQEIVY